MCAGVTSENVAEKYGITRKDQDELAARSHKRAAAARGSGRFKDEIVPVKTIWKDPKTVCSYPKIVCSCPIFQKTCTCCMRFPLFSHQSVSRLCF